ncbi:MAG: transcriptional regulator GcvA [Gammaproteobacteria bacterium]|nr:transcriptional regulator GcvA [Gammaproteobacteria bacterium]
MSIDPRIPLSALRSFEASGRHLSFTRAANELFVTQAAISHQIRRLERYLGVKLFKRLHRALLLTDEGQMLLTPVREAFEQMDGAINKVKAGSHSKRLTISALPSVASGWLVHLLGGFMEEYPDIDLRIAPTAALTDFNRDGVDVVVRYGRGQYPGLHVEWLMSEDRFPACSPNLPGTHGPLTRPEDLARYTLLHDDDRNEWAMWLKAAGAELPMAGRGPIFTDASLAIASAVAGQGVVLARQVLATQYLEEGRLIRLFQQTLPTEHAYYIVYPPDHGQRPAVRLFCDWLLEQRDTPGKRLHPGRPSRSPIAEN